MVQGRETKTGAWTNLAGSPCAQQALTLIQESDAPPPETNEETAAALLLTLHSWMRGHTIVLHDKTAPPYARTATWRPTNASRGAAHLKWTPEREDDEYTLVHPTRQGDRATEKNEPTPEPAATPPPRLAPQHSTLYKQLAHARTPAEHSIQPYTEAAYVERTLQDWTKYETEVPEGHTGPPDTTSRTTWHDVVPDGDIGALATTVRTTFEDCSKPDHPFGDDNAPAITNAIVAYHSWSTQQSIQLHTPHHDRREWHPVGPPALKFYLHEDATTGAHSITSFRPTAPQPIPDLHIPPSPTKPHTPPQNESPQRGHSPPAHKGTEPLSATTTFQQLNKSLTSRHVPDNYQLPREGNHSRSTATTWRLPTGNIDWKKILPGVTTMEVMHRLTPHQVQLKQAMHLFITTQGTATIEGTALGDDDQTPQARPTQAVWVNATADTEIVVDPDPEWTAVHYTLDCTKNNPTLTDWQTLWAAEVDRLDDNTLDDHHNAKIAQHTGHQIHPLIRDKDGNLQPRSPWTVHFILEDHRDNQKGTEVQIVHALVHTHLNYTVPTSNMRVTYGKARKSTYRLLADTEGTAYTVYTWA